MAKDLTFKQIINSKNSFPQAIVGDTKIIYSKLLSKMWNRKAILHKEKKCKYCGKFYINLKNHLRSYKVIGCENKLILKKN